MLYTALSGQTNIRDAEHSNSSETYPNIKYRQIPFPWHSRTAGLPPLFKISAMMAQCTDVVPGRRNCDNFLPIMFSRQIQNETVVQITLIQLVERHVTGFSLATKTEGAIGMQSKRDDGTNTLYAYSCN